MILVEQYLLITILRSKKNEIVGENIQWLWCVSWETGNRQISGVYERFDEGIVVVELFRDIDLSMAC